MTKNKRPVNVHKAYHAHIYFGEDSKVLAKTLCEISADKFGLNVGRFHEKTIGPHLQWSCQVIFGTKDFDRYITWLDSNRENLTVFVHALTGDDLKDHTEFAYWLGEEVALKLDIFENV
jgi:aromatic ring-cleaving dioxygenase